MSYAGGGQRVVVTFCKYLRRDLFNVFAASYIEGGFQEGKFKELGIECLPGNGASGKIIDFIKEKSIDVLHIHRSGHFVPIESEIIKGAKEVNPRILVIEKNVFGKFDPQTGNLIDCSFFQSMMHLNERYLPASGREFDFSRMKVLYNPVDSEYLEKFRATPAEIKGFKERYGIDENCFVIGKIARPHVAKWSDLIIYMMPYLVKLVPDIKFVVVGVPDSRLRRIARSRLAKHFVLIRQIDDEREERLFYQAIDVLAHSSKIGECNGNTINEAMYWGKPIVVNSTPNRDNGQLEQVEHMKDGIIANEPQTFARAIAYLAGHREQANSMGQAGHRKVQENNEVRRIVSQFEKCVIEKLAENGVHNNLPESDFYSKISYNPSREAIVGYMALYRQRLMQNFGKLGKIERLQELLNKPRVTYYKILDFMEHKSMEFRSKK